MRLFIITNKKLTIILLSFLTITTYACSTLAMSDRNTEEDITLSISAVDFSVYNNEPLKLKLNFKSSINSYRLYKHHVFGIAAALGSDDWLSFEIISPSGIVLKNYASYIPNPKRPYQGHYVDIAPDKPYTEVVSIFLENANNKALWPEIGAYRLKATYSYNHNEKWEYGEDLWQGKVESNWVTINIKLKTSRGYRVKSLLLTDLD